MSLVPFSFTFSVSCPVPTTIIVISIASSSHPGSGGSGSVGYTLEARRQDNNNLINVNTNITISLRLVNDLGDVVNWTDVITSGTSSVSSTYFGLNPLTAGISEFDIVGISPSSNSGQAYIY